MSGVLPTHRELVDDWADTWHDQHDDEESER